MGLALPALRYLAREHKAKPFGGKILVLGRQYVFATYSQVLDLLKKEGVESHLLDSTFDTTTNIPNWRTHPQRRKNTSDVAFFALLGLKLYTMDISDYEGADYIHDLNNPIPDELNEMFDVVIDGGTMEHLFNTKQCLENITKMTKIGGTIIHLSPSNNTAGHAFYQFSPDLFFDYYFVNKFKKIKGMYVDMPGKESNSKLFGNVKLNSWNLYELNNNYFGKMFLSSNVANVFFKAEKSKESTFNKIPQQGDYFKQYIINKNNEKLTSSHEEKKIIRKLKNSLKPLFMIKPLFWIWQFFQKRKKYNSLYKAPWGLKNKGKI